jgi:ABC-type uncharacterized transport system ATPase subunit
MSSDAGARRGQRAPASKKAWRTVMGVPAVEMRGITKRFGTVTANDDVSLRIDRGEIRALIGENGAGKSTLMNILYGIHQPDAGAIRVDGQEVDIRSSLDAIRLRIGMVHQHFMLAPSLTVAENIALGQPGRSFAVLNRRGLEESVSRVAEEHGLAVPVRAKVGELPVGVLQRAEIVKALYRGADTLILDEPTAVLTPQESEALFETLRSLAKAGKTVIFISHKLREVLAVSRRITVMRKGRVAGELDTPDADETQLARLMIGSALPSRRRGGRTPSGEPALRITSLSATSDRGVPALRHVSLDVRAGAILGIAGVEGNGQTELAEVITGIRPADAGTVELYGRSITNEPPRKIREAGIAHIPEDRLARGVSPTLSIQDNVLVNVYHQPPYSRRGWLAAQAGRERADALIDRFAVAAPHRRLPVSALSGGNVQKLVVARELGSEPRVVVAAQPTRGVDIGAMQFIHDLLLDFRHRGAAILLISADLDEIFALSDTIAVMYEGEVVGSMDAGAATRSSLGLLMSGTNVAAAS